MAIKVGINGFGRIGRLVFRRLMEQTDIFEVVGINDLTDNRTLAMLLKYDSIHRRYPGTVEYDDENLIVDGRKIRACAIRNPAELPWGELGATVILESTGAFRARKTDDRPGYDSHIDAGAKKVVISAPAKNPDRMVVMGVNDDQITADDLCISNASCTTNCLAPMAMVINDRFGIVNGLMTTIHSYTNDQQVLDFPHSDLYRARAAAVNIIPTTTGAAEAVGVVLPALKGKLTGFSLRVPTPTGSCVDLVVNTEKPVTADAVNAAMREESEGSLAGILGYTEDPIVSSDIIHDPLSAIFAADWTTVVGDHMLKVLAWYDNEWGYSCRSVDLIKKIADM